jgi:phosphoenolpyruvate---glycerone phosphotransferase subunit DhaL
VDTGQIDSAALRGWIGAFAAAVAEHQEELTRLDSAIGDADHGSNLARGMKAVVAALDAESPATPDAVLKRTGMTLVSTVGGASGPLYGTFFLRMATTAAAEPLDAARFGAALRAGVEGVVARGRAELGDKTMYDALAPAVDAYDAALDNAADDLGAALRAAADAAATGRDATTPLQARKGRASYLGERSVGHQDPGATSAALLLAAAASALG